MNRAEIMKTYIPTYLRNSQVFTSILTAEGQEMDQLLVSIDDMLKQYYVETATEGGLALWEQYLNLSSYAGKPLDQRRSRIISKIRGMGTVTVTMIQNVAESYVYGSVQVTDHPETYSFVIKFIDTRGIPSNLMDVQAAIEEIKPAHLGVSYEFSYMTWDEFDGYNKAWGAWDALNLSWDDLETYREV